MAEDVWDADLVRVKYDASKVSVEQMLQTIEKQGFQAKVQQD